FYKTFKITPQETENVLIYKLDHSQWDIPKLRQLLEEIIPRNSFFNGFEVTHEFDRIGRRTMLLNARRLDSPSGATQKILLGIEDFTERRRSEEALRESERRYRSLCESIDEGFCVIEVLFDSQQRAIDFVYVETNPAFEKQTGLHGAQGRRILELAPALER